MGELRKATEQARQSGEVVKELLETAKRLRLRAAQLAKESDVFAAKAAEDLAEYLEEVVDQWPRLQARRKVK